MQSPRSAAGRRTHTPRPWTVPSSVPGVVRGRCIEQCRKQFEKHRFGYKTDDPSPLRRGIAAHEFLERLRQSHPLEYDGLQDVPLSVAELIARWHAPEPVRALFALTLLVAQSTLVPSSFLRIGGPRERQSTRENWRTTVASQSTRSQSRRTEHDAIRPAAHLHD